ncbi:MAG: PAS domain S-box protein [Proteobacteria bacterium]|nr:PAS domain S-box protein [Pseudomonadota bacterium]
MNKTNFTDNFRKKILFAASAGLLLACLCVALTSVLPLYKQLKAQQANHLIFAAKTRSMVVEEFLAKAKETALQITSRSKIREFLEKYNNNEIDLTSLRTFSAPKLQDALNLSQFAVGISRLDHQGKLVVEVGMPVPEKFLRLPNADNNEPLLIGPIAVAESSYLVVAAPILNRQGLRVGMDIVLFTTSKLLEIAQDYTGLGNTGETLLGEFPANCPPVLFFPTRSVSGPDRKALISGESVFREHGKNKAFIPNDESSIHLLETPHDLAAYGTIQGVDWGILVVMDKNELFKPITRQVLIIALVISVLVIPLGMAGLIFLLRPLSDRMIIHVDTLQRQIKAKEQAILQRSLVEELLLEEKERLNVTLQSIGDGVITTDLDGNIVLINKITEHLTGWSLEEASGKKVQEVFNTVNKKTGTPCDNPVDKVLASGKNVGLTWHTTLIARDGTQHIIEDSGAPIFDKENKIIGTVLVFRDVTEKRRTAAELLKIKKLESVGVLAGGIAHDFNNILAAILGNIELAGMSIDPHNEAYPLLQEAKKASIRAKDLTQQLLTFSKGGEPVKKTTPISKTIMDSANFVLHGSTVSCHFNIADDLWLVDADPGQISQVIQNLVINAKHAMPAGGQITINCANIAEIRSETPFVAPEKNYIKITVQDNGCGITDTYLEKIFDPYFTTKQEGSGLGLAVTHSIIKKHNGNISVQSKMGEGTVFTIYLPASADQISPESITEIHKNKAPDKAKILVMDDEELVQNFTQNLLSYFGHDILHAWDGQQAIKIFTEHFESDTPIDIIIMDLTIPGGMGGKEAVLEILKIDPAAQVIVSSGYSNDPVMAEYQKYGFKAALAKPFLMADMQKTLSDLLA